MHFQVISLKTINKAMSAISIMLTGSLIGSLSSFSSSEALAGTKDGGGGIGVLCQDTLRVLDLYEWEELNHLSTGVRYPSLHENLETYGSQLGTYFSEKFINPEDPSFKDMILKRIQESVLDKFKDIPDGSKLPISEDATLPHLPQGCSLVQIAFYSDSDDLIYRDPLLWVKLDSYDQAALILHEIAYRSKREVAHPLPSNSDSTRRLVGRAMSGRLGEPMFKPLWSALKKLYCVNGQSLNENDFATIEEERNGIKGLALYFFYIKNDFSTVRTSAFIPHVTLNDFIQSKDLTYSTFIQVNPAFSEPSKDLLNLEIGKASKVVSDIGDFYSIQLRIWKDGESTPEMMTGQCNFL